MQRTAGRLGRVLRSASLRALIRMPPVVAAPLPCRPADQMCLWCYHHILEEAAKASLAARCPNCRSEYDEEKIKMQHIDAEQ